MSATATRIQSPEQLGRKIRARRRELYLTQQPMADPTGVNRVVVGQTEHGKSTAEGLADATFLIPLVTPSFPSEASTPALADVDVLPVVKI